MLTRRGFAGFASCAICGITEFVATAASAQGAPPAASGGVTRKILSQTDGPMPGYVTVLVEAIIEPGVPLGRHTHPGIESAYVLEGGFELPIQGQPTRTLKVGDAFQIPPETPHAGGKPGDAKSRIYCVPRLLYFAVPRHLEFMSELPTAENGKVQKYKLRERGVTQQTWDGGPTGRKGAGRTSA